MSTGTCPTWCDDHMDLGDLTYCQSVERDVTGHGLILVGPGTLSDGSDYPQTAGVFLLPAVGAPLTEHPLSPTQARDVAWLFRGQADRLSTLAHEIEEAARLVEKETAS